jgi:DNA-binding XRE family transcriptional regulator
MTQQEAADAVGAVRETVNRYEAGDPRYNGKESGLPVKLGRLLNVRVSVDDLFPPGDSP